MQRYQREVILIFSFFWIFKIHMNTPCLRAWMSLITWWHNYNAVNFIFHTIFLEHPVFYTLTFLISLRHLTWKLTDFAFFREKILLFFGKKICSFSVFFPAFLPESFRKKHQIKSGSIFRKKGGTFKLQDLDTHEPWKTFFKYSNPSNVMLNIFLYYR